MMEGEFVTLCDADEPVAEIHPSPGEHRGARHLDSRVGCSPSPLTAEEQRGGGSPRPSGSALCSFRLSLLHTTPKVLEEWFAMRSNGVERAGQDHESGQAVLKPCRGHPIRGNHVNRHVPHCA